MAPPTILFENAKVRVAEFRLAPGDKTPMHTHPEPYVAYVLVGGPAKGHSSRRREQGYANARRRGSLARLTDTRPRERG
jgi:hypothetical protein